MSCDKTVSIFSHNAMKTDTHRKTVQNDGNLLDRPADTLPQDLKTKIFHQTDAGKRPLSDDY